MRWLARLLGGRVPPGFTGALEPDEHVLATTTSELGSLVATTFGLWVPGEFGPRRIGWHLISKAGWTEGRLSIVEAEESERVGEAVVIADLPVVRFSLPAPGRLPQVVRQRVDGSIRARYHKDLPDGGAWFVRRRVIGVGDVLQVRPDPAADLDVVARIAREAAQFIAGND